MMYIRADDSGCRLDERPRSRESSETVRPENCASKITRTFVAFQPLTIEDVRFLTGRLRYVA